MTAREGGEAGVLGEEEGQGVMRERGKGGERGWG